MVVRPLPCSPLFPYTTLFRSLFSSIFGKRGAGRSDEVDETVEAAVTIPFRVAALGGKDRKSTRLNSSHRTISYAVFCLKKKRRGRLIPSPDGTRTRQRSPRSA